MKKFVYAAALAAAFAVPALAQDPAPCGDEPTAAEQAAMDAAKDADIAAMPDDGNAIGDPAKTDQGADATADKPDA